MSRIVVSILLFNFLCASSIAQTGSEAITVGERVFLESNVLEETREIWVSTPVGYAESEEHYPLLIVLDGRAHFRHVSATTEHLQLSNRTPGMIVAGVLSTDRARDFTPTTDYAEIEGVEPRGEAANFLLFLESELIPMLEENYRARDYRIIVGHSLSGLFVIHALMASSETFNGYIAISPSLQWSGQAVVNRAMTHFPSVSNLPVELYMSIGNEGGYALGGLQKIAGVLTEDTPPDMRWNLRHFPKEHHNSVPLRSVYYGLESVFSGWSLREYLPLFDVGGLDAINNYYRAGGARFGYERSMPTLLKFQIVDDLINLNRIDDAASLITEEIDVTPPSYFLNLIAGKYLESGNDSEAERFYRLSLTNNPTDTVARQALNDLGAQLNDLNSAVSVPVAVLEKYVGIYQPMPDIEISIFLEDTRLFSQVVGQRSTELVPLTETRFSVTDADSQIEFYGSEEANAEGFTLHQFGQELDARRIEDQ